MAGYSRFLGRLALIGACAVVALGSERASAQVVDCDSGGRIQAALDSGQRFIEFTGTCYEIVSVNSSGTTIRGASGNPAQDVIADGLFVSGAQKVLIENLTVSGVAFNVGEGAYVTVRNSIIENTNQGFGLFGNAGAWLEGNTFGPALMGEGACAPICVGNSSFLGMVNNTVNGATNDPGAGAALGVYRDSSLLLRGGNVISNSGTQPAIGAWHHSSVRQDNRSGLGTGQITGGVLVFNNSFFDTRQAVITGDIEVALHSTMRVGDPSGGDPNLMVINQNIALSEDSALTVESPLATINGDVTCTDGESSATGDFAGTGENLCSGFSSVANDFDGDGKADLLWRNTSTGTTIVWLMDGATQLAAQSIGNVPLTWQIDKVEDYNGDGKSDIFWRNSTTGANIVWLMDGFEKTVQPADPVPTVWQTQPSGAGLD